MKCCCSYLCRSLERGEMFYDRVFRYVGFYIKSPHNEPDIYYGRAARHCPYCGSKMPKIFDDEYYDALEEAVGKEFCDIKEEEIPPEFQTDEWWKKRGL